MEGMYLNSTGPQTVCSYCQQSCLDCSSENVCTSCPTGLSLVSSSCSCDATCSNCSVGTPNCILCTQTIFGTFGQCTGCDATYYLDGSNTCTACSGGCVECTGPAQCTSCQPTLEVIGGLCGCDSAKGFALNTGNNQCEQCDTYYPNCATCQANGTLSIGYECASCVYGFYLVNETCAPEVCGDGLVTQSEQCDDGNNRKADGCFACRQEQYYNCTGEPSVCLVDMEFKLIYDSSEVSTTLCNHVYLFFTIYPPLDAYDNANFDVMYAGTNYSKLEEVKGNYLYSKGVVGFLFEYKAEV